MPLQISLLRGINVGGHKKIKMADLRTLYEQLGFQNVQSYIQSGNLLFETTHTPQESQKLIEKGIKEKYGFDVDVLIISKDDLQSALKNSPYTKVPKINLSFVYFLNKKPQKADLTALDAGKTDSESYHLQDQQLYVHYPDGSGRSKLTTNFIEKKLAVTATARNLKTVKKILELMS